MVDADQRGFLLLSESALGLDGILHIDVLRLVGRLVPLIALQHARLGEQGLRRDIERVGDQPDDPDRRLMQAALDLAEVGIGQPRSLGQLAQGQIRQLPPAADEGAEHLHLRIPLILHGYPDVALIHHDHPNAAGRACSL